MSRERFCEAAFLYRRIDEQRADATTTLRAAEALAQGGDRAGALAIVQAFPARFPEHALLATALKRIELLQAAIAKVGPGETCSIPLPQCGNGLVESGESCDDGNRADGDACPSTCSAGAALTTTAPTTTAPTTTAPTTTAPTATAPTATAPTTTAPTATAPTATAPTATAPTATAPTATAPTATAPTATAPTATAPTTPATTATTPTITTAPTTTPPPQQADENEDEEEDEHDVSDGEVERVLAEPVPAPAPEPTRPGPPIVGIAVATTGGLVTATSLVAVVVGVLPAVSYLAGARDQAAAAGRYRQADTIAEQRQAAGDAADAYADQATRAFLWNSQGRWLAIGGGVGLGVGVGLLVGGLLSLSSNDDAESGKDGT
jgi:cysteine-rich repeat protein